MPHQDNNQEATDRLLIVLKINYNYRYLSLFNSSLEISLRLQRALFALAKMNGESSEN